MKPGRLFTGARTPRFALLFALLGLSSGCVTPKADLKTPSPNLRLPKPSNVNNTPREMPPKPADAPTPLSVRNLPVEVAPTTTGPGVMASGQSINGNLTTTITPQPAPPRNNAVIIPVQANAAYVPSSPIGRDSGTISGIVMPDLTPAAPVDPLPLAPPVPPRVGVPALPGSK